MKLKQALEQDSNWWAKNMPNFALSKFHCRCKKCQSKVGAENMDVDLLLSIQSIREHLDKPMIVTSGFRCKDHPKERVKKTPGSHSRGLACDIGCWGAKAFDIMALATGGDNCPSYIGRIGVKQKGDIKGRFLHLQKCDTKQPSNTIFSY